MASGKRIFGTVLFILALAVTLGFLFLLYADSVNDDSIPFAGDIPLVAIVAGIVLGVVIMLLALLLIIRGYDKRQAAADDAEAFFIPDADRKAMDDAQRAAFEEALAGSTSFAQGPEIVVYNLARVPRMGRAWAAYDKKAKVHPYYFPRSVEAAVYTNDYVVVDNKGTRVKLMTLLAGPKDADQGEIPADHKIRPAAPKPAASGGSTPAGWPESGATAPDLAAPMMVTAGGGSESFMRELEAKTAIPAAKAAPAEVFYDYPGDIHLVEDVEGIGIVYGAKLRDLGIETTARLGYEDAGHVADRLGIARTTVETWQSMAELMKAKGVGPQYAEAMARAGVKGIADLKKRSAASIADQVNEYLQGIEVTVVGQKITAKRVEGWQDAAKSMRRIRLKVPEK